MASPISNDEMLTLYDAEYVRSIADDMPAYLERCRVAASINRAANTGDYMVRILGPLSETIRTELENTGYTVAAVTNLNDQYDISWKK